MKFWKHDLGEPESENLVNLPTSDIVMLTEFEGTRDAAEVLIREYVAACNRNGVDIMPELLDLDLIHAYMQSVVPTDMIPDMMDNDFDRGVIFGKIVSKVEQALKEGAELKEE